MRQMRRASYQLLTCRSGRGLERELYEDIGQHILNKSLRHIIKLHTQPSVYGDKLYTTLPASLSLSLSYSTAFSNLATQLSSHLRLILRHTLKWLLLTWTGATTTTTSQFLSFVATSTLNASRSCP